MDIPLAQLLISGEWPWGLVLGSAALSFIAGYLSMGCGLMQRTFTGLMILNLIYLGVLALIAFTFVKSGWLIGVVVVVLSYLLLIAGGRQMMRGRVRRP